MCNKNQMDSTTNQTKKNLLEMSDSMKVALTTGDLSTLTTLMNNFSKGKAQE